MDAEKLMTIEELSPERRDAREKIEAIYRSTSGRDVGLGATEEQWAFFEALLNNEGVKFRYTYEGMDPDYDRGLIRLLEGAEGVIEMTDEESFRLWQEEERRGRTFERAGTGYLPTIGYIGDMPVTISITSVMWEGEKFVIYTSPSTVTDHRMIDRWLEENMPSSAWRGGRLNRSDATNAHNLMPRKESAA